MMKGVKMAISGVGATPEPQKPKSEIQTNDEEVVNNSSIWAEFNDSDNKVDISDVKYNQNKKSSAIKNFLEKHNGESWTSALKSEAKQLINRFNLECEGDDFGNNANDFRASFDNFKNSVKNEFENFKAGNKKDATPKTGATIAALNDDGTTFEINLQSNSITKYAEDGTILEKRAITTDEQALSANDLISKLQSEKTEAVKTTSTVANQPKISADNDVAKREIRGEGIVGTYQFEDKDDGGYNIKTNFLINSYKDQASIAYKKGLENKFGLLNVRPDKDGNLRFRGITAKTYNILQASIRIKAQEISGFTAIYNDLNTKQKNGEELSTGEQKFMQDFNNTLNKSGLKINDYGELEDL